MNKNQPRKLVGFLEPHHNQARQSVFELEQNLLLVPDKQHIQIMARDFVLNN